MKIGFGALALALVCAGPAFADTIENFFVADPSSAFSKPTGKNPYFMEVTLDQATGNTTTVQVTVTLNKTFASDLVKTGNSTDDHPTFGFNILGDPKITVSPITTGYSLDSQFNGSSNTYTTASGFGNFDYAINWGTKGGGNGNAGPLVFDVSLTGGGSLTINNFVKNASGFFFVADILGANGQTGLVASMPEPPTPWLFGAGLLTLLAFYRRKSIPLPARSR